MLSLTFFISLAPRFESSATELDAGIAYDNSLNEQASAFLIENTSNELAYVSYPVPLYSGKKSFMYYSAINNKATNNYALSHSPDTITDPDGFLKYQDRYLIALGSYFNVQSGDYVDLILANGEVIPCIVSDGKDDKDTDASNIFSKNGCMSEFIVSHQLNQKVKHSGDASSKSESWASPVINVIVYQKNIFS